MEGIRVWGAIFFKRIEDCSALTPVKITEVSLSMCLCTAGIVLSSTSGCALGFRCILDLVVVILAKLEGLEDLALFRQCYVMELSPGWDMETWVQFRRCHLLTESGQVASFPRVPVFYRLHEVEPSTLKDFPGSTIQLSLTLLFKTVTCIKIY